MLSDDEIFIDVHPAEIDIVYLATLGSFMMLMDPGRVTPWVSGKGWMRGGPQRSGWPTSREERASNAPAGGRVVRDEYNLANGHAMRDRDPVNARVAVGGTPAAPGSGQLAFISPAKGSHLNFAAL
jgi:hypothetical protein